MRPALIDVYVKSVTREAQGINSWEFRSVTGADLPSFEAGAHIDLHLSNGLIRSYSLINPQGERHRYVVAINQDPKSRGGSAFAHDMLKAGARLRISAPRNNFRLVEDAASVAFIAGGIGITPIWGMIQRLEVLGRSWELFYSVRQREMCAFREPLSKLEAEKPGRVHFNYDHEPGGRLLDLAVLIAALPDSAHLYCCGPPSMLRAFEFAAARRPQSHLHVEYFSAREESSLQGGFTVVLNRSGMSIEVPPGKTILRTLLDHNVDVPCSCTEGVCGTCETRVLEGIPDHKDSVLTPEERTTNKTIMVCCSGSKSPRLVLDL